MKGSPGVLLLAVHAEHEHREPWPQLLNRVEKLQAAGAAERDVQDDDVPVLLAEQGQRFSAGRGVTEYIMAPIELQQALESLAYVLVVINDQNLGRGCSSLE